jgi:glutamate synthase (NADPH/NADH) small chain
MKGSELLKEYDAICLAVGAMKPRDLAVEGRELKGIHFAMEFLTQQNHVVKGQKIPDKERINAKGKNVLVIGGGDTGSDCIGTSARHGAKSILQIEILPKPPEERLPDNPWPFWANILRTSSSHEEGCERRWNIATRRFMGKNGQVTQAEIAEVDWVNENGKMTMVEKPETIQMIDIDLVLLAMGFLHPIHEGVADEFGLEYDARGNIKVDAKYQTSVPKVFAAGDSMMGASLVVRAIDHGRQAAKAIHEFIAR